MATTEAAFGELLRRFRFRTGLSQNQLARLAGVDPAYVNRLERGGASIPSRRVVLSFCDVLETSADDRERLLVAAGHCPEAILRAGGWDAYRAQVRQAVDTAVLAIEAALRGEGEVDDTTDLVRRTA